VGRIYKVFGILIALIREKKLGRGNRALFPKRGARRPYRKED